MKALNFGSLGFYRFRRGIPNTCYVYRVGSVWGFRLRIDTSPFGPVFAAQAGRGKKVNAYIILYFEFVII